MAAKEAMFTAREQVERPIVVKSFEQLFVLHKIAALKSYLQQVTLQV